MKNKKKLFGIIVLITASFLMGSFFNQSEAKLKVIKAGVDEKGNQVCINKSQVYLFKKNQAENKILFYFHDAQSENAMVAKSFPDLESLDKYWEILIRDW
ncbi:MAG: hypothetical protein VX467_02820 [Verrucomicrobiota bacterium]|nr:hypothetical protein [Verrucomicrobiota bacterium]